MQENHYSPRFDGPIEVVVVGDNNTVVYEHVDGQSRQVPFLAPLRPPYGLVGRSEFLSQLKGKLLTEGTLGLVALDGRPGIGKTALAIEIANDHEVLRHFRDGVLWCGLGKAGDALSALARWGEALGVSDSDLQGTRSIHRRAHLLHSAIGLKRMLLVVDDAWTPEDALAFRIGGPNCAHVVTSRLPAVGEAFAGANTILVPDLDNDKTRELLENIAGEFPEEFEAQTNVLIEDLGGLPLSILLVGTYLRGEWRGQDRARLRQAVFGVSDAHVRLRLNYAVSPLEQHPSLPPGAPLSLPGIIGISYDALEDHGKACLRALSLFPPKPNTFSEAAARETAGQPLSVLRGLVDRRLVDEVRAGRYTLHQSTWDFISRFDPAPDVNMRFLKFYLSCLENPARSTSEISTEETNLRHALALAQQADAESFERAVLAYTPHLVQTGAYRTAATYLRDANRTSEIRHAPATRKAEILAKEGSILFRLGSYAEAETKLQLALSLTSDPKVTSGIYGDLGTIAERGGEYSTAEKYFANGIEAATSRQDDAALASLLNEAGWVSISRGRYEDAEAHFTKAYRHAETANSLVLQSAILLHWGWAKIKEGDLKKADEILIEGMRLAHDLNYQERIAAFLINLGVSAEKQGDYRKAEKWYEESLAIAERLGNPEKLSAILTNLGLLAEYRGRYDQAKQYGEQALEFARAISHQERISNLLQNLSSVAGYLGNFDSALSMNSEALELAMVIEHPERVTYILQERAGIFLLMNRLSDAEECLRGAAGILEDLKNPERTATFKACMADLSIRKGEYGIADSLLAESEETIRTIGHVRHATALLVLRGELDLARGRPVEATLTFETAWKMAQALDAIPLVADSEFGLCRCANANGDRAAAQTLGKHAQQLFAEIGHFKADVVRRSLEEIE